jgi:serine/threonine protein kinase
MEPEEGDRASSVEALATVYLLRTDSGEQLDPSALRATLATEAERAEFDELLRMARIAERHFPVSHAPGGVLGGRYRLLSELGAGGTGKVWLAHDAEHDRKVAVKVFNLLGADALERRERAAGIPDGAPRPRAPLAHENIVRVHELGRDGDLRYLVMDLVDGRPLSALLAELRVVAAQRGAPPTPADLLRAIRRPPVADGTALVRGRSWHHAVAAVMARAARAVEAAHGQGVLHRGLKPSDVVLRSGGHPVLLDFGLAGEMQDAAGVLAHRLYGSASYLAPEQIADPGAPPDPRTDVYQLGVVLYEALTLQRAFPSDDTVRVLHAICAGDFAAPRTLDPALPVELEDVCLMAMELDLERRYASAALLRADLERCAGRRELPVASRGRTKSAGLRMRCFVRSHRAGLLAGAVIAAAALAFFALRA